MQLSLTFRRPRAAGAIAALLFAIPAAAQVCPPAGAKLEPRVLIPLFRYEPVTDNAAASHFRLFSSVLNTKVAALAGEASSGAARAAFASGLRIYTHANQPLDDTLQDAAQRKDYWDKSNSLGLLRGRIWPGAAGKPQSVQSDFYIGELRGAFPRPELTVQLPLDENQVSTTNDSHSVVTYYALAMEARRLGCDQAISRGLLARAASILRDIRRRAGKLSGDLAVLATVISQEEKRP